MTNGKYFLVCFFCLALAVPLLGDLFGVPLFNTMDESRQLKTSSGVALKDRLSLYVKNFDSKFWGREVLLKAYIGLKKDVFGISPLPEKVVMGKDGWLYLADYGTMDDCRNLYPFNVAQLDSIQRYLSTLADTLVKHNKKLYVMVVPDKHTIYPEFLPSNIQKLNPVSRLEQVTERLNTSASFKFINLTDVLIGAKRTGPVYLKKESHWNDRGTFAAYQHVMKIIKADFAETKILNLNECNVFEGDETDIDLMKLLGESITYTERSLKIVPKHAEHIQTTTTGIIIPPAKRLNTAYAFRKVNGAVQGSSIIVFRDSFFGSLVPFVEQSFPVSNYIWTSTVDVDYILQQEAPIVLLELAERNLNLITH